MGNGQEIRFPVDIYCEDEEISCIAQRAASKKKLYGRGMFYYNDVDQQCWIEHYAITYANPLLWIGHISHMAEDGNTRALDADATWRLEIPEARYDTNRELVAKAIREWQTLANENPEEWHRKYRKTYGKLGRQFTQLRCRHGQMCLFFKHERGCQWFKQVTNEEDVALSQCALLEPRWRGESIRIFPVGCERILMQDMNNTAITICRDSRGKEMQEWRLSTDIGDILGTEVHTSGCLIATNTGLWQYAIDSGVVDKLRGENRNGEGYSNVVAVADSYIVLASMKFTRSDGIRIWNGPWSLRGTKLGTPGKCDRLITSRQTCCDGNSSLRNSVIDYVHISEDAAWIAFSLGDEFVLLERTNPGFVIRLSMGDVLGSIAGRDNTGGTFSRKVSPPRLGQMQGETALISSMGRFVARWKWNTRLPYENYVDLSLGVWDFNQDVYDVGFLKSSIDSLILSQSSLSLVDLNKCSAHRVMIRLSNWSPGWGFSLIRRFEPLGCGQPVQRTGHELKSSDCLCDTTL